MRVSEKARTLPRTVGASEKMTSHQVSDGSLAR